MILKSTLLLKNTFKLKIDWVYRAFYLPRHFIIICCIRRNLFLLIITFLVFAFAQGEEHNKAQKKGANNQLAKQNGKQPAKGRAPARGNGQKGGKPGPARGRKPPAKGRGKQPSKGRGKGKYHKSFQIKVSF